MSKPYLKRTTGRVVFNIFNGLFMSLLVFAMIYPFYYILILSFNDGIDAIAGGFYLLPRKFSVQNYAFVLSNGDLGRGAMVSVLRVLVGTVTGVICNALLGYIVSAKHFFGRKFMRILFLVTMYLSGGLIPVYLLYIQLGFMNTFHVYWIPSLFSAFYMLLISSYMQGLPDSLFESAKVDGASELRTFVAIALPLCVPVLASVAVYIGVGHWNSWFDVSLYSKNGRWDNLQIILYRLLNQATALQKLMESQRASVEIRSIQPTTVRAATTIVVTTPILIIYPFLQKYFVSGITIGAVKG